MLKLARGRVAVVLTQLLLELVSNFVTFWRGVLWALRKFPIEILPPEVLYNRGIHLCPKCLLAPASIYGQPTITFQLPWTEIARPVRQPSGTSHIQFVSHVFCDLFFRNTVIPYSSEPWKSAPITLLKSPSLPFYCTLVFLARGSALLPWLLQMWGRQQSSVYANCRIHTPCSRNPPWGPLMTDCPLCRVVVGLSEEKCGSPTITTAFSEEVSFPYSTLSSLFQC